MKLIIAESYEEMSRIAADVIEKLVQRKPHCVLGLATGDTPKGLYRNLVADFEMGLVSFRYVRTFNLDEYRGLGPHHHQSYRYFMQQQLFDAIDINSANTHVPQGDKVDSESVCNAYEQAIHDAGGLDLQLLGLGHNGHIGFNEPAASFPVRTHCVKLTESTITANSRLFDDVDEVPREAYTMGIGTIMKAREILLIANGEQKADIVYEAVYGPVVPEVPASVLQLHPCVTVVVDRKAGARCVS